MSPFFSVIIPSYNRASFLENTINSVLQQTFRNWELVVVDDGSTDNTDEVVQNFQDSRIKYFKKKNEERSIARNYGIGRATGRYICFLDSDDQYYESHLQLLSDRIKKENFPVGILHTGMVQKNGAEFLKRPIFEKKVYSHPIFYVWEKFMLPSSVCVHKDCFKRHLFPEQFHVWEDTHLWLRLLVEFPFFQIKEYSSQWNVHKDGTVEKNFENLRSSNVIHYLECIANLEKGYGKLLSPFLKKDDFLEYRFRKLKMFMKISYNRKQFFTFWNLYWYGILNLNFKKVHSFLTQLLRHRIRLKVHSYRTR